jgi:hypothetical protein
MENVSAPRSAGVDAEFLHQVDVALGATLARVVLQEQEVQPATESLPASEDRWEPIMSRIQTRLETWHKNLVTVADEVRAIEAELQEHQGALRAWTEALRFAHNLPGAASGAAFAESAPTAGG